MTDAETQTKLLKACADFSQALEEYKKRMENERKWRVLVEQTLSKNKQNSMRV